MGLDGFAYLLTCFFALVLSGLVSLRSFLRCSFSSSTFSRTLLRSLLWNSFLLLYFKTFSL